MSDILLEPESSAAAHALDITFLANLCCFLWTRKPAGSSVASHWTMATPHFIEWLTELIYRTESAERIQMLALLILFRLVKKTAGALAGMPGSEYRTLLSCLALANKCLEDNTYTSRTWSDVAGISVEAINFAEREILRALDWKIQPKRDEWNDFQGRVDRWKYKRREALASPSPILSSPALFDPAFSMTVPFASPVARSQSQPGSPLRLPLDEAPLVRKRKVDEAGFGGSTWQPAPSLRRSSLGALVHPHPRSSLLFQGALQQNCLRSASLSPISTYASSFSPASGISTPYSTPPAVFSPTTQGYLTARTMTPAIPLLPCSIWQTVLVTDPLTGQIITQMVNAPVPILPNGGPGSASLYPMFPAPARGRHETSTGGISTS